MTQLGFGVMKFPFMLGVSNAMYLGLATPCTGTVPMLQYSSTSICRYMHGAHAILLYDVFCKNTS